MQKRIKRHDLDGAVIFPTAVNIACFFSCHSISLFDYELHVVPTQQHGNEAKFWKFQMGNVQDARREMTKTKEQLEEEKKISLSIRIKPLDLDAMDHEQLQGKASELWETIVRLETEKYDLEERQKRQDYDVSVNSWGWFFS